MSVRLSQLKLDFLVCMLCMLNRAARYVKGSEGDESDQGNEVETHCRNDKPKLVQLRYCVNSVMVQQCK